MRTFITALMLTAIWTVPARAEKVTFNRHVAAILWKHCANCHHPGAVGPFSLLTYKDAAKRARFLKDVTASGRMRIGHSKRTYALKRRARQVAAGTRVRVGLRLSKRGLRALRTAVRHHRRVTARLTATARDPAGNQTRAQKLVRVRR